MGTVMLQRCERCGDAINGTAFHRCPELVLVCGSRGWSNREAIEARLKELPPDSIVVAGGARGADRDAAQIASALGFHVAEVKAQWHRYGGAAGMRRNLVMLRLKPDRVIAFSLGTNGTQHTIDNARTKGITVEVIGQEADRG